ncbi:MAG: HK97 family phage prohead protease [Microthrixaceae bacterium]
MTSITPDPRRPRPLAARLARRDDTPEPPDTDAGADTGPADDATGYALTGIAVPFGEQYDDGYLAEQFDPACVFEGLDESKVYWQHGDIIGRVTAARITPAGLEVDLSISHTTQGDEAATLVRDGVITALSIGFEGIEYTYTDTPEGEVITWTSVRIREVSLVSFPAYEGAVITEVRSRPIPKGTPAMPDATPDLLTRAQFDETIGDLTQQLRAAQATLATMHEPREPSAPRFRSFGHFVRAYHRGDSDARKLHDDWMTAAPQHTLHERAYAGGVLADTVSRDQWVGDAIRLVDKGRKVLNSFQTAPLPTEGTSVEYGVLESNTVNVDKQLAEGDELAKGQVQVGTDNAPIGTYGGWSELSFQAVERSSVSILDLTRRAQLLAYASQTEDEVRALLRSTITANLTAGHALDLLAAPKAADWVSLFIDAFDAFEDAALPVDGLYLSKDKFKALATLEDTTGRLQFEVFGSGMNSIGRLKIADREAETAVTARILPGATPATGAFYSEQAITTFENAGAPLALEDTNITNLTRSYSVYGYLATACEIPDAILPINFA